MARLKHSKTGVVVVTSDENASRLSGYEPVEVKKPPPAKSTQSKTEK